MREYEIFIDGKFVPARSAAVDPTVNAFDGSSVAWVPRTSDRDLRRAIEAARRASDAGFWAGLTPSERAERISGTLGLLWERQAEIADLDVAEAGIPIRQATDLVSGALSQVRPLPKDDARPYGVVSMVIPGDAPFSRAIGSIVNALIAGNTVAAMASDHAPSSALEIARAFAENDIPPGVVNICSGGGRDAEREMASNPLVDAVSFGGTKEHARAVAEAAAGRLSHSFIDVFAPGVSIILEDADLDIAIPGTLWGAFVLNGLAGRGCSRVFVPASIAEPVAHHLARGARSLRAGDPGSFETDIGALPHGTSGIAEAVSRAADAGATLLCGGNVVANNTFEPTVILAPRPIRIASAPGPWLAVIPYEPDEDVVALANVTRASTVAVWSRSDAYALARRSEATTAWTNAWLPATKQREGYTLDLGEPTFMRTAAAPGSTSGYTMLGLERAFTL